MLLLAAPILEAGEMRGLWVVRTGLTSPADIDRVVDHAHQGGFNALFVQVRGRGDAFYRSKLVPRSRLLARQAPGFDPLARLIARAKERGLAVHAWVNVLLTADFPFPLAPSHVLSQHPEWVMVPRGAARAATRLTPRARLALIRKHGRRDPDVEGYYLSPSAPGVGERLEAVVTELVGSYPLQGLHFDFIRYPGPGYDYSPSALAAFQRLVGGDLLGGPARYPARWNEYRRRVLNELVVRLQRAARRRPGLLVSAAVAPDDAVARSQKFQDWPAWLGRGLLDAVCPMVYTANTRVFRRQVQRARDLAQTRPVWAGVGAYRMSLDGVLEKIRAARESGAAGVVLFSQESLGLGDFHRLRREVFRPAVARRSGGASDTRAR